ncbi:Gfo/Idh/MocA family protein [Helicobacter sp.]|uniref:Gfo/Idh/MocA family protein n=1 Tax=Helicobacter sp. TaxID=218 RepID=UPI0025BB0878|nr:Gfo/Idh/MocA family oxidoreductase [Helicobacter sp.]MCI5968343.1 Gfo/Idh/MocA family oxidoreductase [Helicobacter sp.]MDY2584848.1 Gfo/Idh/MocA family oxidoreductase [Helicobacter sp.]
MRTIGVGVIGMGWMGKAHSSAYINYRLKFGHTGIIPRLVICSEVIEERAKEAKERFGFEKYSMHWKDVVDDDCVEIVEITAPNALHLEIIKYCVAKGKHINCEKPVGAFLEQSIEAYNLVKNYPYQTFVGFNYRWAPLVQYVKELLDSGKLGEVYSYKGRFFSCYAADALSCYSWRFEKENGLGAITDLMSHAVDMALYLLGDIKSVSGVMRTFIKERPLAQEGASHYARGKESDAKKEVTNEDYVGARVSFCNGAEGFIDTSRCFVGPTSEHSFEIHASKGSVKWNFEEMNTLELYLEGDEQSSGYRKIYSSPVHPFHQYFNPSNGTSLGYDDLKTLEIAHFLGKIFDKNYPYYADFQSAARVAKVLGAIIESNTIKEQVKLEMEI